MVPAAQEALRSLHAGLASCLSYLRRRVLPYAADALAAAASDAWAAAGLVAHQLDEMYPHLSLALLLLIGALLAWRCCCGGGPADKRWGGSSCGNPDHSLDSPDHSPDSESPAQPSHSVRPTQPVVPGASTGH